MKLGTKFNNILENHAKRVTLLQLRQMHERQLLDCGISPGLLALGVKAWPWRELEDKPVLSRLDRLPSIAPLAVKKPEITDATVTPQKAAA